MIELSGLVELSGADCVSLTVIYHKNNFLHNMFKCFSWSAKKGKCGINGA